MYVISSKNGCFQLRKQSTPKKADLHQELKEAFNLTQQAFKKMVYIEQRTLLVCKQLEGHSKSITSLALSKNGSLIATGSADKTIKLWETTTGLLVNTLTGHFHHVNTVVFSSDNLLASGSLDKTVRIWNTNTGAVVHILIGHAFEVQAVAFSWTRLLASGSVDGEVCLWSIDTGDLIQTLESHTDGVYAVAFNKSNLLATGRYVYSKYSSIWV